MMRLFINPRSHKAIPRFSRLLGRRAAGWILGASILLGLGCGRMSVDQLLAHPKTIVSSSAEIGYLTGWVIGMPVSVVLSPVTWRASRKAESEQPYFESFIVPAQTMGRSGAYVLGEPAWMLFGWWGDPIAQWGDDPQRDPSIEDYELYARASPADPGTDAESR